MKTTILTQSENYTQTLSLHRVIVSDSALRELQRAIDKCLCLARSSPVCSMSDQLGLGASGEAEL